MCALHRYIWAPSGDPYASFRFACPSRSAFTSLPISSRPASTVSSSSKSNFARRCSVMILMPSGDFDIVDEPGTTNKRGDKRARPALDSLDGLQGLGIDDRDVVFAYVLQLRANERFELLGVSLFCVPRFEKPAR